MRLLGVDWFQIAARGRNVGPLHSAEPWMLNEHQDAHELLGFLPEISGQQIWHSSNTEQEASNVLFRHPTQTNRYIHYFCQLKQFDSYVSVRWVTRRLSIKWAVISSFGFRHARGIVELQYSFFQRNLLLRIALSYNVLNKAFFQEKVCLSLVFEMSHSN